MRLIIFILLSITALTITAQEKQEGSLVSIDVEEKPLGEVLLFINEKTGEKIAFDEEAHDLLVSVRLIDIPWKRALKMIGQRYHYELETGEGGKEYRFSRIPTVTMEFEEADIRDIMNQIAVIAYRNVILPETLKGNVSLRLRNVPWKEAMETILKGHGHRLLQEKNIYRIVQSRKEMDVSDVPDADRSIQNAVEEVLKKMERRSLPKENTISLDVKEKRLGEIVEKIGKEERFDISCDEEVSGLLVTLKLSDLPWRKVLGTIAQKYRLIEQEGPGFYRLGKRPVVSMEFQGVDVRDVFPQLASLGRLNLILAKETEGSVTLSLRNLSWREAVEEVSHEMGYALHQEGDVFRVGPRPALKNPLFSEKILPAIRGLASADPEVKIGAIVEIAQYGERLSAILQPISLLLEDAEPSVRKAAAESLGKIGGKMAIPGLAHAVQDPDYGVRYAALLSLMRIGKKSDEANLELLKALKDKDPYTKYAAVGILDRMGERAFPLLSRVMEEFDHEFRYVALEIVGKIEGEKLRQSPVTPLPGQPADIDLRGTIFWIDQPKHSVAFLNKRVFWKEDNIRNEGILLHDVKDREIVLLLKDRSQAIVRMKQSPMVPLKIGEKQGPFVQLLQEALKDRDERVRTYAAWQLGLLGEKAKPALPLLREAIQDPDEWVRIRAKEAVQKIMEKDS